MSPNRGRAIRVLCFVSATVFLAQALMGQTWTQLSPSGTPPVARGLHGTTGVYDPESNRMMVFGGRDGSGTNLNDVWVLTNANGLGGASQWVNLIPNGADGSPPARSGHSATYDAANNIMIIFGGCSGYCTPALNDVWTLSNANGLGGPPVWTQLPLDFTGPAPRTNAVVAYNPAQNLLLVYSGQDGSPDPCSTFSDVWTLFNANGLGNPPSWARRQIVNNTTSLPPALNGAAVAYDPVSFILTMFGGTTMIDGVCRDTNGAWELSVGIVPSLNTATPDGAAGSPPARSFASGVFDAAGARMIIFGGEENGTAMNDVWGLSNATGSGSPQWHAISPSGSPPAERNSQAAIFDFANQRMTIFGGSNASGVLNDSWVLTAPGVSEMSCNANAGAPNIVRGEGIAETVGDVVLICTGGAPTPQGQPIPQYTVTMTMNTDITSRPLPEAAQLSEALILIDEPFPANPFPTALEGGPDRPDGVPNQILCQPLGSTCPETGTAGDPSPYQTQPNMFFGQQTSPTAMQWTIPIDPPGANLTRILRLTNVRVNANALGISTTFIPTQEQATVAIQGAASVPIHGSTQTVAISEAGATPVVNAEVVPQCLPRNKSLLGGSGQAAFDFSVQVREAYGYSFKNRDNGTAYFPPVFPEPLFEQNIPGFAYRSESVFYSPSFFSSEPTLGLADSGTRILVKFGPHHANTHLFVPVSIQMTGNDIFGGSTIGQLQLVKADVNGVSAPGYQPVLATKLVGTAPVAEMTYAGTTAYATYEVLYADPSVLETATIPVAVAFNQNPTIGPVSVTPSLAPLNLTATASASAPVPRFASIYATQPAFAIEACVASTLSATIPTKTGPQNARVWNIKVKNGAHPAAGAQIESFTISQQAGKKCAPIVTSPAFPLSLGDIPKHDSVATPVTIDFTGCASTAKFKLTMSLSANEGLSTNTVIVTGQTR
jgi:hypothetical protein